MVKKIGTTVLGILLVYASVAFAMKAAIGVLPVDAAIARAKAKVAESGMYLDSSVIAHPDPQLCKSIL